MSVSRRTLLLAGGTAATLLPLGGILPAAQAATPSAAGATPAATPIPDPVPVTGTWKRTSDGGQKATAGRRGPALALSEQQLAAKGTYAARVTPQSSSSIGALVFRAALDGSTGYAVALDPGRARIRLYDLAGGDTLADAGRGVCWCVGWWLGWGVVGSLRDGIGGSIGLVRVCGLGLCGAC
ncbi:hypothetical protein ABZV67_30915 [Streptomyces sp. NPDC005065]|uniref:hypothetical protein n=1 Tax=unclassified Streptomyces TaxID=2593676 RepID=UPI0033B02D2A